MKDAQSDPGYGRTNWRRFAVAVGVPTVVAGGLILALSQGALAANFAISGQNFHLTASSLHGEGFTQYSGVQRDGSGTPSVAAMSGIGKATIHDLCQSVVAPTPLGTFTLRIEAGQTADKKQVNASNLLIGMSDLQGDATFTNINIGQDAGSLNQAGADAHGTVGGFGQGAEVVDIKNLKQTATSTTASSFELQGMHLSLAKGNNDCFNN